MPHLEILGSPIGDTIFCANVVSQKCANASQSLSQIEEVGSVDPQVALLLLRMCGAFCKMVHLARSTPPSLVAEGFRYFETTFVIALLHAQEWTPVMMLGSRLK